ncbi:MAG: hypothetical protein P4N59_08230, partial [Negativicutes bacterium]|nr:hypothetical protein [Negativicutes bacterium]
DSQIALIQLLLLLHKCGPNQGVIGKDSSAFLNCHTLPPGAPGAKDSGNRRAASWAGRPDNRSATFERSGTTTSGGFLPVCLRPWNADTGPSPYGETWPEAEWQVWNMTGQ